MSAEFTYNSDAQMLMNMGIFMLIYFVVVMGVAITFYVLRSLGMYTIAKRRGIKHPWFAWLPAVNSYLEGCISDQYQYVVKGKTKSKRKVMLTLSIIMWVLYVAFFVCYIIGIVNGVTGAINGTDESLMMASMMAPILGALGISIPMMGVAIALTVFHYMAMYDLYSSCSLANNVLFLVLSIFVNVTEPFFIFFNRKKDDGMPPRKTEPQPYMPVESEIPTRPVQEPWEMSEQE